MNKQVCFSQARNKILAVYFSFVIACLTVILSFITATTYLQLAIAILLYPLLVFFAYRLFPKKLWRCPIKPSRNISNPPLTIKEESAPSRSALDILDIDKRVFLKLIGGAGLFLFLFSIFNKKGENLFFKNIPASGKIALEDINGKKIDPAQNQPLDGYNISEIYDDLTSFYGFTNKNGGWYIMKVDTDAGSFRYAKGGSNFPGNWTNKENLNFDYFNNVFK